MERVLVMILILTSKSAHALHRVTEIQPLCVQTCLAEWVHKKKTPKSQNEVSHVKLLLSFFKQTEIKPRY
jgi:hypothetical protein